MTVRVVTGGLQTTVQDLGRTGHQRIGVPAGGAMDRQALRLANALVGNADGDAGLEVPLIGPALSFDEASLIAITGAALDPTIDGTPVPVWHAVHVAAGATLHFGRPRRGCRAYVAIAGGIDVPLVFGSRSTYLRAGFGGLEGRAVRTGDRLAVGAMSRLSRSIMASLPLSNATPIAVARWSVAMSLRPHYSDAPTVRVVAGTHVDALTPASRVQLFGGTMRVSSASDRMGYRLEGPPLLLRAPLDLLSEGVAFGTVQLPPGGAPIVLMADRQTTGGYPRVAEVASVDLPLVAQLKPGDKLRFRLESLEEAQRLYLVDEQELAQARAGIELRFSRGDPRAK